MLLGVRQLFVDQLGLAAVQNLATVMHQATKKGAIIRPGDGRGFGLNGTLQTRSAPGILSDGTWRLMVADTAVGGLEVLSANPRVRMASLRFVQGESMLGRIAGMLGRPKSPKPSPVAEEES